MGTMDFRRLRAPFVVAATMALLALATAGAAAPSALAAHKKAPTVKQFKALQKLTRGLAAKVKSLEAQTEALSKKAPVAAPPAPPLTLPTTLPPSGPAGGSLLGTYPNPRLAASSVTGAELADGGVHTSDLAENSVGSVALANHSISVLDMGERSVSPPAFAPGAVTAPALGGVFPVAGKGVEVTLAGGTKRATVSCPAGTRLLAGGYEWASLDNINNTVLASSPIFPSPLSPENPATTWQVFARTGTGAPNTIFAEALCLN